MTGAVKGINLPFCPLGETRGNAQRQRSVVAKAQSFDAALRQELHHVIFSQHAQQRLLSRDIHLSENDLLSLQRAISLAQHKGARDSLIVLRDLALIVSVDNNTVVTAIDHENLHHHVFTNIDSAVIAR